MRPIRSSEPGAGRRAPRERGLTVVELLVATVIALVVLLAAGTAYMGVERSFRIGSRKLVAQQEATLLTITINRLARIGGDFLIYNVPNRATPADSGDGLAILDDDGNLLGRVEWNADQGTLVDASGAPVTAMQVSGVRFRKDAVLDRAIRYRFAVEDGFSNLVNVESSVSLRN